MGAIPATIHKFPYYLRQLRPLKQTPGASWTVKGQREAYDTGRCYFFNTALYFAGTVELCQGLNNPKHTYQGHGNSFSKVEQIIASLEKGFAVKMQGKCKTAACFENINEMSRI